MKPNWPTKKLGDLCEHYFSGIWGEEPSNNGNVFIVRVSDVKDEGIIDYNRLPLRYVEKEKIPKYQLRTGDLVVVKSSGSKKKIISGKAAIFSEQKGKKILASNFVLVLRLNQKLVLPKWLLFYLNGNEVKEFIKKIIGITTYPNLRPQEYLKFEIPLPPLKIQKRIVARIEELFEKIDKAKELRKKAQEEISQIFPLTLEEFFNQRKKEKWQIRKVGDVIQRIQYGLSAPIPKSANVKNALPILRMANIITNGQIDYSDLRYIEPSQKDRQKFILRKGDVLFNWRNSKEYVGKTAVFNREDKMIFASFLLRLEVKPQLILPEFLNTALNWLWRNDFFVKACNQAVSQANFNASKLKEVKIPLPPLSKQKRIVAELNALREKVEKLKQLQQTQLKELDELKQSILNKAFKGELVK